LHQQVDANLAAAGFTASDFDAVVAADKFEAIKPAPDIFLAAARLMGTPPAECVVVEDAPAGVQAAKNAGGLVRWNAKFSSATVL
jgi:HAD superfamily hydrolase (TIGR01509 family)